MSIYETMWNELKNRVNLNISKSIPKEDIISFMNALEEHFNDDIIEEALKENKKKK